MASEILQGSLDNLLFVYKQIDTTDILSTPFPNRDSFYEGDIHNLHYSFLKFLNANPDLNDANKTTLIQNYDKGIYNTVYSLYHDLRVACTVQMLQSEEDENRYLKIDKFFKLATELLLREAVRLGVVINIEHQNASDVSKVKQPVSPKIERVSRSTRQSQNNEAENETSEDLEGGNEILTIKRLLSSLEKDFDIITSTFYSGTGKSLSIFAAGNIPFFTSLNNFKSDLDDRELVIDPVLGVSVTNIIPNVSMENKDTLGKMAETNIKIPHLRQILENYMHPNWLRLISSPWLKHGSGVNSLNFTFAPTHDETQSIISNDWKGLTWCQQIGFKKLVDLKCKEVANEITKNSETASEQTKEQDTSKLENDKEINSDIKSEDDSDVKSEGEVIDDVENFDLKSIGKVDIKNIINYDESKLVSESESKIVENNNVQSTISDLLIELNQLRQKRITKQRDHARYNKDNLGTGGRIFRPTSEEVKLYHKIRRLVAGLIQHKNIKPVDLKIPLDTRIPVIQHTYQGTLPAVLNSNQKVSKAKRRR
ncbi:hypothetical protein CANINC_002738 [Pichia inconspicua]|uniref:Bromo domain-containing protein n=1 Tax=Pichia inconspicua TaxID=52247 RepID=A0A4T0X0X2_9ASCO|nr:hypothetical protein CANINC_002738 [[Candida] inconspicua]